jgi:hypothetical protein
MRCLFFDGSLCNEVGFVYSPTAEEKEDFCEYKDFRNCPRYLAYVEILSAT